ncbi:MAG: ATP-binding protein [bacterium]
MASDSDSSPTTSPGTSSAGTLDRPEAGDAAQDRQRVALVGVDAELAELLGGLLDEERCETVALADAPALLERAADQALDLVLIDIDAMGAEPGATTAEIKRVAPQTMVMPLSGQGSAQVAIEAMRAGAYDFFQKPVATEELRHRLHRALENKRLGQAIQRRTLQLQFVNQISNAISASLDLGQVLQTAAAAVRELMDFDLAAAALGDGSEPVLTVHPLTPAAESAWEEGATLSASAGALAEALDGEARLSGDMESEGPPEGLEMLAEHEVRSLVLLPLISKGRGIGVLVLASRRPRAFAASQLEVLRQVGGHLASAVENAQLYEQLKTLSNQLEETVAERSREVFEVKQYLENLVETAGDAVIACDVDGAITSWNRAAEEHLGYSKDAMIGRQLTSLASGEGARDQLTGLLERAREGKIASNVETAWERQDHKEATVSLTVSPIIDHAQQIVGLLIIARDVTERKKLQEELFHSEKLASIGQLAAGVAHQINNPLGAISGRTQMMLRLPGPFDEEFVKEQLGKVQADCARITETVNDLLGFARKTETVKQYTDVNTILEETLEMVRQEIIARKVRVSREFTDNLPPVVASANHLRQLMANLVTNACDAMDTGGTLTITTEFRPPTDERREPAVEVAISDTGCGIPPEELSRIFEPFYTTKPAGQGTGLGLAVAKRIVDFHNGSIEVHSDVDAGTTFTIRFPVE